MAEVVSFLSAKKIDILNLAMYKPNGNAYASRGLTVDIPVRESAEVFRS